MVAFYTHCYTYIVALSIKSPETEALAREVAALTGESLTAAITNALRERLDQLRQKGEQSLAEQLDDIALRCAALPDLDTRPPEDIIGYDEHGIPR